AMVSSQLPAGLAAAVALAGDCAAAAPGFALAAGEVLATLEVAGAAAPPQPASITPVKSAPTNVRTLNISVSLLRESHRLYIAFGLGKVLGGTSPASPLFVGWTTGGSPGCGIFSAAGFKMTR